ncbi:MAG TPA: carbamate kinase [archaeon]|nr:carbamate kinase [archaeon]
MKIVIAFGGNSISNPSKKESVKERISRIENVVKSLRPLSDKHEIIITHGNGSDVGNLLIQQEKSKNEVYPLPLDTLDAMTQGQLGYWLQRTVNNLWYKKAVSVITTVIVDKNDHAFENPTKPIGPFYKEKISAGMVFIDGKGFRKVVPSPRPIKIVEADTIKKLVDDGYVVIACGGGGIPVIKENNKLVGIEAVVDKDLCTEILAEEVDADIILILTDVDKVCLNFGKPNQKKIDKITVKEAERYLKEEQFGEGSMKPKIEACIKFLKSGGKEAIICLPEKALDAIEGKAGTIIVR